MMIRIPDTPLDLTDEARRVIADATGFPFTGARQFYVVLLQPSDAAARGQALGELRRVAAIAAANIAASGLDAATLDATIDSVAAAIHGRPAS